MTYEFVNNPQTGVILAHDIYGNTKEIPVKDLKFRISVYGILKEGNKFLVQLVPLVNKYALPGGAIERGEHIMDALVREYEEETGLLIKATKLLDVREDFFIFDETAYHSLLVFYLVEKVGGQLLTESNGDDSEKAEFLTMSELKQKGLQKLQLEVLDKV